MMVVISQIPGYLFLMDKDIVFSYYYYRTILMCFDGTVRIFELTNLFFLPVYL